MSLMGRDFIIWYTGSYSPNIHHNLQSQTVSCPLKTISPGPSFTKKLSTLISRLCPIDWWSNTANMTSTWHLIQFSSNACLQWILRWYTKNTGKKWPKRAQPYQKNNTSFWKEVFGWMLEVDNFRPTLSTSCEQVVTRGTVQFIKGGGTSQYFRFQHRSFQFNLKTFL